MEIKKINFKNISEMLSNAEMKNVLGGSGGICDGYRCVCYCNGSRKTCTQSESVCNSSCGDYGVDWCACN